MHGHRIALIAIAAVVAALGAGVSVTGPTAEATFPGDNGKIAYVASFPGEIRTVNPDGTDDSPLISTGRSPAWSADGTHIAFTRFSGGGQDMWMARADGGGEQLVVEGGSQPAWSPDGTEIVFVRAAQDCPGNSNATAGGLSIVDVEDGPPFTPTILTNDCEMDSPNEQASNPEWSPDGAQIYFTRWSPVSFEYEVLYAIPADGGDIERIAEGYNAVDTYSLSPDGEEVVLYARKGDIDSGDEGVFVYNFAEEEGRKVREYAEARPAGLSWSPDGSRIAYISREGDSGTGILHTMDPQGGDVRSLTAVATEPAWGSSSGLIDEVEFTQGAQQVQSIPALKADLEGDGEPPVPIVAGKPAAMRVMFNEVDEEVEYIVDSNLTPDDVEVTLKPGCDEIDRRSQKDECESVDFYFVPPEGDYSVELFVRTPGGDVVEEHEFDLTSARSPQITLVAVSVCDNEASPHQWDCGDETQVNHLASFLRAVAPTDTVEVRRHNALITRQLPTSPSILVGSEWFWGVRDEVQALYVSDSAAGLLPPGYVIYVGAIRPGLPLPYWGLGGGLHGLALNISSTPMGVDSTQEILAHEVGHVLGADHTGLGNPAASSRPGCYAPAVEPAPDWPESDNHLYTVGFDTITGEAKPGSEWFELMAYCGPQWISTHTTLKFLAGLNASASLAAASTPEEAWVVSGTIDGGTATFGPLLEREDIVPSAASGGQYTLEVRGSGGAVLSTQAFEATAGEPVIKEGVTPPDATPFFSLVVPTQAGAESIVVLEGSDELGVLQLTGAAPTVVFDTLPGSPVAGEQEVSWSVTDPDSGAHTSWLEYSTDGGATWETIAAALAGNALVVDFDALGGSGAATLRVLVSDGALTGTATTEQFSVSEKAPEASIIGPVKSSFRTTQVVVLQADAHDADGPVTVTWSSSKDGNLGSGETLPVEDLTVGSHTITMTAKDSDNNTVTDTVTISVSDRPIVEGEEPGVEHIWGDNDCNGSISSRDNQALTRFVLDQAALSQTRPCPAVGDVVTVDGASRLWGDLDCDGDIKARDGQALLRRVLGQAALSQTQPCPVIGDTASVAVAASTVKPLRFW